jgi:hypothetical protein
MTGPTPAAVDTVDRSEPDNATSDPNPAPPHVLALGLTTAIAVILAGYQAVQWRRLYDRPGFLGAGDAQTALLVEVALMGGLLVLAVVVPRRLLVAPVLVATIWTGGITIGVLVGGGQYWQFATAVITLLAMWWTGRTLLGRAFPGQTAFVRTPLVATTTGYVTVCLVVFLVGRLHAIRWWTIGVAVIAAAVAALATAARDPERAKVGSLVRSVTETRFRALAASIVMTQAGWALAWAGLPEIQFDALHGKAWQPALWAERGNIGFSLLHPHANNNGLGYIAPVPGHVLGGDASGRYLQYLLGVLLVVALWRLGGLVGRLAGPIAALALSTTPHLVWQMSTAGDDLTITLVAFGAAVAAIHAPTMTRSMLFRSALLVGLLAGGAISAKLHLLPFGALLGVLWACANVRRSDRLRPFVGVILGALVSAGGIMISRWIATGNPIFPQFNNVFRSQYFPPVNDKLNLPYLADGGLGELLRLPDHVATSPSHLMEAVPPGIFGLLIAALVPALLLAWRVDRAHAVVWGATLVAVGSWWWQLRYLRYLLPYCAIALLLLLPAIEGGARFVRRRGQIVLMAGAASVAAVFFASTIAAFWNVPERVAFGVAFGRGDREEYLDAALPISDVVDAANDLAAPGDRIVGALYPRAMLRLDIDMSPEWEFEPMLRFHRGDPPADPQALLDQWRSYGARWIAVETARRLAGAYSVQMLELLDERAQLEFARGGYELYRLVDDVPPPVAVGWCNGEALGDAGCWAQPLDQEPGLSASDFATDPSADLLASQPVAICSDTTYEVAVTTGDAGAGAFVTMAFYAADNELLAFVPASMGPSETMQLPQTAPAGSATLWIGVRLEDQESSVTDVEVHGEGAAAAACHS